MKFLSLFAGIGGFDVGLEWAGMECAGQVEWDPWCSKVLAKRWPAVKRMGDRLSRHSAGQSWLRMLLKSTRRRLERP
jgi:site-specific DNA-cytosine methylase